MHYINYFLSVLNSVDFSQSLIFRGIFENRPLGKTTAIFVCNGARNLGRVSKLLRGPLARVGGGGAGKNRECFKQEGNRTSPQLHRYSTFPVRAIEGVEHCPEFLETLNQNLGVTTLK